MYGVSNYKNPTVVSWNALCLQIGISDLKQSPYFSVDIIHIFQDYFAYTRAIKRCVQYQWIIPE